MVLDNSSEIEYSKLEPNQEVHEEKSFQSYSSESPREMLREYDRVSASIRYRPRWKIRWVSTRYCLYQGCVAHQESSTSSGNRETIVFERGVSFDMIVLPSRETIKNI